MKIVLDICFALLVLIALSPVLLIVILLILIVERKAPFFFQNRIGLKKTEFKIYKFRTMLNNKTTPLGRVLRKTGIDELPQLVNIIKGQMSFVGPRPLTQNDIQRLGWDNTYYNHRWSVRPGIAGLAQLTPVCHKKMSWFYDQLYIKSRTIWLDFKILAAAVLIPLLGKQTVKNWIHGKK
ncbi:MAG: lipopolysaccharide/colanic/teichoic acid biosynthesis glycosyltransferase [Crocinitomix sp.]|jgi:lipopolysaccharide/colanic/teichoic acid biosynthesis glycosyltransferase